MVVPRLGLVWLLLLQCMLGSALDLSNLFSYTSPAVAKQQSRRAYKRLLQNFSGSYKQISARSPLLYFYVKGSPESEGLDKVIKDVEEEIGGKVWRVPIGGRNMQQNRQLLLQISESFHPVRKLPFFFHLYTHKFVVGTPTKEVLKAWAVGQQPTTVVDSPMNVMDQQDQAQYMKELEAQKAKRTKQYESALKAHKRTRTWRLPRP